MNAIVQFDGPAQLVSELKTFRRWAAIEAYSALAIERALQTGQISYVQALDLIARTWPQPEQGAGYSFGAEVSHQASIDAYRNTTWRRRRS